MLLVNWAELLTTWNSLSDLVTQIWGPCDSSAANQAVRIGWASPPRVLPHFLLPPTWWIPQLVEEVWCSRANDRQLRPQEENTQNSLLLWRRLALLWRAEDQQPSWSWTSSCPAWFLRAGSQGASGSRSWSRRWSGLIALVWVLSHDGSAGD